MNVDESMMKRSIDDKGGVVLMKVCREGGCVVAIVKHGGRGARGPLRIYSFQVGANFADCAKLVTT